MGLGTFRGRLTLYICVAAGQELPLFCAGHVPDSGRGRRVRSLRCMRRVGPISAPRMHCVLGLLDTGATSSSRVSPHSAYAGRRGRGARVCVGGRSARSHGEASAWTRGAQLITYGSPNMRGGSPGGQRPCMRRHHAECRPGVVGNCHMACRWREQHTGSYYR